MPVSFILINTPSLCSSSLQLTMLKDMVPLCGIGLRVHCFSKVKRLYFRELFLVQVLCYKVSSAPSSLIVEEQIQKKKRGSLCQLNRYYLFIYGIKNPKSICVKNVRSYKRFYRTRYLRQNLEGGVVAPLAFSQSTCGGSSEAQFTVSTAFCTPLFSSMGWLNFQFLLHFWIRLRLSKGITCCLCR